MVKARTNDCCIEGFAQVGDAAFSDTDIRLVFSDVSETAAKLQRLHGLDRPAAAELGRAIAAVALFGVDFREQNDSIIFCAETSAPIDGWHVEISGRGALRGYLFNPDPDYGAISPRIPPDSAFSKARLTRVNEAGDIVAQSSFGAPAADIAQLMAAYHNGASRVTTRIAICAASSGPDSGAIDCVRALAIQYIDAPSNPRLARIAPLFDNGAVATQLELDPTAAALGDLFGIQWLGISPPRALAMSCTCSQQAADESYATRSPAELAGMALARKGRQFRCHLCGAVYDVTYEKIEKFSQNANKAQ